MAHCYIAIATLSVGRVCYDRFNDECRKIANIMSLPRISMSLESRALSIPSFDDTRMDVFTRHIKMSMFACLREHILQCV